MAVTIRLETDHTQIETPDADFVDVVDLSIFPQSFWDVVKASGGDIRVHTKGGTELAREVGGDFDKASQKGHLYYRSGGHSTATNDEFDISVDGSRSEPSPGASNGRESVWPTGSGVKWAGVWHLEEDPTGTIADSTDNSIDLSSGGSMTSSDSVSGKLGDAIEFDGSDDNLNGSQAVSAFPFTFTGWAKPNNITDAHSVITISEPNGDWATLQVRGDKNNDPAIATIRGASPGDTGNNVANTSSSYSANAWNMVVARFSSETDFEVFLDGGSKGESSGSSSISEGNFDRTEIGTTRNDFGPFGGAIDEVRSVQTVLSDSWIATDYNNQSDPTTSGFFASVTLIESDNFAIDLGAVA